MKRIFTPNAKNELLRGWLLHAHKMRDRHDLAARGFSAYAWWLSLMATLMSAAVGTSVFASLSKDLGTDSPKVKLAFGIIAMIAAGLAALQATLKLGERAEKHRAAGAQFKVIIRDLETLSAQAMPPGQNGESLMADLKKRLDNLEVEAPVVPHGFYNQVEARYSSGQVRYVTTVGELTGPDAPGLLGQK